MNTYLVIPTIRTLTFLTNWKKQFNHCHLIIVEDSDSKKISLPAKSNFQSVNYFNHQHINNDLKEHNWIIGHKNASIRVYGYLKAYQAGADIIITLDDDCYPTNQTFVQDHLDNLIFNSATGWYASYPDPQWMYTRGFPYKQRNKINTAVSHGLWSGALDLDGKTEIKLPHQLTEKPYPPLRQIIPKGYYYPMCGMNLAFKAEFTPIMFFPMMGEDPEGRPWGFDRFDDIWAGILSKKILDHLGYAVVNGSPFVEHRKASDPGANYQKEKTGLKVNENFWKWVDVVHLTKSTPKDCYIELAKKAKFPKTSYFNKLREAMIIWANPF